jgi:hypothetical protein
MAGLVPVLVLSPAVLKPMPDFLPVKTRGQDGVNTLFQNAKKVLI